MRYTSTLIPLSTGVRGTKTTLSAMERLVQSGIRDPEVVLFAQEQVRNQAEYGKLGEIDAILTSVRRSMRYTPDPVGVETVKSPTFIMREIKAKGRAAMDCDDASVLAATLIRAVGVPTRFKVIKDSPTEYTHVYLEALVDGSWVKVDPIAREMSLGHAPEGRYGSAYFQEGRMYRGMGAASSLEDIFGQALSTATDIAKAKYAPQPASQPAQVVYRDTGTVAPAFPWGKIALVAGLGIGAIVALRMIRKRK